jgi:serine/threonine protein kinase
MAVSQTWLPPVGSLLLDRYEVKRLIGNGPTGAVFLARDRSIGRQVVIKAIHPDLFGERFRDTNGFRVQRARSYLHDQIAMIREAHVPGTKAAPPFLSEDLVDGPTLRAVVANRLENEHPLDRGEVRYLMEGMASAVRFIHRGGVHGNLKPENVFLVEGQVVLTDAYFLVGRTRLGWLPGELPLRDHYLAPEQLMRVRDEVPQSDIFAMGMILGELLAGEPVRCGVPLSSQAEEITPELDALFLRATANEPLERHISVDAFLKDLRAAIPELSNTIMLDMSDTQVVELGDVLSGEELEEVTAYREAGARQGGEDLPWGEQPTQELRPLPDGPPPPLPDDEGIVTSAGGRGWADEDELDRTMIEPPPVIHAYVRPARRAKPFDAPVRDLDDEDYIDDSTMDLDAGDIEEILPELPDDDDANVTRRIPDAEDLSGRPRLGRAWAAGVDRRPEIRREDVVPRLPSEVLRQEEALILDDDEDEPIVLGGAAAAEAASAATAGEMLDSRTRRLPGSGEDRRALYDEDSTLDVGMANIMEVPTRPHPKRRKKESAAAKKARNRAHATPVPAPRPQAPPAPAPVAAVAPAAAAPHTRPVAQAKRKSSSMPYVVMALFFAVIVGGSVWLATQGDKAGKGGDGASSPPSKATAAKTGGSVAAVPVTGEADADAAAPDARTTQAEASARAEALAAAQARAKAAAAAAPVAAAPARELESGSAGQDRRMLTPAPPAPVAPAPATLAAADPKPAPAAAAPVTSAPTANPQAKPKPESATPPTPKPVAPTTAAKPEPKPAPTAKPAPAPAPAPVAKPAPSPKPAVTAEPKPPKGQKGKPPEPEVAGIAPIESKGDTAGCPKGMQKITRKATTTIAGKKVMTQTIFCIDYHEYPGGGAVPKTNVSWFDAASACESRGKRLCTSSEWKHACGGKYPYGKTYDPERCNTMGPNGEERDIKPAGSFKQCKSPYGLYDMSGNVAEWTADKTVNGGNARQDGESATCGNTSSRMASSRSGTVGFRCCADPE